jgi:U3 small nucleolar ribonucleoprotein protein IMP4
LILVTTTRRPSKRTRSFVRDLYHVLPNSTRRNRGKMSLEDLNELAIKIGADRVIVVGTQRGNPSSLTFYEPTPSHLKPISIVSLSGVSLRREITKKRAPPSKRFCVASPDELENEAELLAKSFNVRSVKLEELKNFDISLILASEEGLRASFYRVSPMEELGPRMRISGIKEYGESLG